MKQIVILCRTQWEWIYLPFLVGANLVQCFVHSQVLSASQQIHCIYDELSN